MSATVIDAFVATLGLDGTLFKRGMKDAEAAQEKLDKKTKQANKERDKVEKDAARERKKRQAEADEQTKSSVDGYKKMRTELLSIAAIFTAGMGIKGFLESTIKNAAGLGYMSQNLQMSTQELTAWQRATERANGSAAGIISQLKESQETLAQLHTGQGPNSGLQAFFQWGGKSDDLKDGNTYLLARSRIIADIFKQDPAKAALIAKSMGIIDDQFDFLKQGPDAVRALVHEQEQYAAITQKDAEASQNLVRQLLDLRDSLTSTGTKIAVQMIPLIDMLVQRLMTFSQWAVDHREDIARWMDQAVEATKEFVKWVDKGAESVGGWKNVLIGLAGLKFAATIAGLSGIATAIGGIVSAGLSLPGILVALAGIGAYAGWKGAEALSKWMHKGEPDAMHKGHAAILAGGTGNAKPMTKDQLKAEAARQMATVATSGNSSEVVGKLVSMGWSREQAAGIAASFMQESELNPAARNPTSGAYGIAQWLGPRVADFKAWSGRDLVGSSLDDQLRFFQYEVTDGKEKRAGDKLRAARTAEDAARIHSEAYERPGIAEANVARRQRLAAMLASQGRIANAAAVGAMPAGATSSYASLSAPPPNMVKNDVKIDSITINTKATDAPGIAQAVAPAVQKYMFATQSNSGMQ